MSRSPIISITLSEAQRALLSPLLDTARLENGYEGVLCSIARCYSPQADGTVLQLQVTQVPKTKLAKLLRLLAD